MTRRPTCKSCNWHPGKGPGGMARPALCQRSGSRPAGVCSPFWGRSQGNRGVLLGLAAESDWEPEAPPPP